jgi:hypothetical protein
MTPEVESQNPNGLLPKSGCQYTFVDAGSNTGDTVNAFVHAERHSTHSIRVDDDPGLGSTWPWDATNPKTADFDYQPLKMTLRQILQDTIRIPLSIVLLALKPTMVGRRII